MTNDNITNPNIVTDIDILAPEDVASTDLIEQLRNPGKVFYSSINIDSRPAAIKVYNALNNSETRLDDHKGEVLSIVDVVAHSVRLRDNDGNLKDCLRTVLIDQNGTTYATVSEGVLSSLSKIFALISPPPFDPPLELTAKELKTRNNFKVLTLQLVG